MIGEINFFDVRKINLSTRDLLKPPVNLDKMENISFSPTPYVDQKSCIPIIEMDCSKKSTRSATATDLKQAAFKEINQILPSERLFIQTGNYDTYIDVLTNPFTKILPLEFKALWQALFPQEIAENTNESILVVIEQIKKEVLGYIGIIVAQDEKHQLEAFSKLVELGRRFIDNVWPIIIKNDSEPLI